MNRIVCLLSTTLLFTFPTVSSTSPFLPTEQSIEKQIDLNGMVFKTDKLGLIENPFITESKKEKLVLEKNESEKTKEQKINEPQWQTFVVSFYTGLDEENFENCGGKNCLNQPLERGMIANNSLPMGTKIYLDNDYGIRTVADKGSSRFNSDNRIDLYVARYDGESKEQWRRRANSYGIKYIRGYIVK